MSEVNIVVVESPKKARRFKENFQKFVEKNPKYKNKFFFISTSGSINDVNFPRANKVNNVNFPEDDIEIKITKTKKENLDHQLKDIYHQTTHLRDWATEPVNFIIASDPDREGAGIAKGVTSYLKDLKNIETSKIVKPPFKYIDIESYSFIDLFNRLEKGDYKKNYDVDLGNQQVMRSAIDKFLGFSSASWTSNKVKFSTGRIKRPLLYLINEGQKREEANKETDVIDITYTCKEAPGRELNRSFVLKDPIKKELLETQLFSVKYEDLEENKSYVPNLAELLLLASQRSNISMKDVYRCVEKLYLGVRLKYTSADGEEYDVVKSLISYPRTDSKVIENLEEKRKQQDSFIVDHMREAKQLVLKQEFFDKVSRKFKNKDDKKKYPYIQKGHEALLPNFISITPLFLSNVLYNDGSEEMQTENTSISLTYMALRDQVYCTLYKTPRTKELKLYYRDENQNEVNVPLLVPETIANKDVLAIDVITNQEAKHLTSELSLFKQMLKHNLARPSTYHQITNNIDSFRKPKFNHEPLVTSSGYEQANDIKITKQGQQLLEETKNNPYFNIKYTKTMEKELGKLTGVKNNKQLKKEIANKLSEINNNVNKNLPKEVKEEKSYNSYQRKPSRSF